MKFLHAAIIAIALLALTGCGGSKSSGLPATQNAPKFATATANDFVKNFSQTANDYAAAITARDVAKINTLTPQLTEVLNKRHAAAKGLKLDEAKKLQVWVNSVMQQVTDAAAGVAVESKSMSVGTPIKKKRTKKTK